MSGGGAGENVLRGRLSGEQRNRLCRLLNMLYRPSELAQELGINVRLFYQSCVPLGCPHERDHRRHLWINGAEFREWYRGVYAKRRLQPGEGFCMTCRKPVQMQNRKRRESGSLEYWLGECPHCGRRISRIIRERKSETW